ncbi:hypothetical protein Tco_0517282 [Tanacetum coccineum]
MCHTKDYGPSRGLYLCQIILRYRCARTELITPDLTYPSTYQLLRSSGGDSGPDLSFDKSASPERLFSLARVSLAEVSKPDLSFEWSGGDYTSSCSLNLIEPTVTLFRVFQTLCKQGDWLSFAKRRAPSLRHLDAAINDPRPSVGSFNMVDVHRLSAHVLKLRDMPEGVFVLSGLIMGIHDFLCLPEWTSAKVQEEPHFDVSSKIVAKAEASQKRKDSTSGATSSHVAKRTRYALAQSSDSTTRPSLFVGDDDESDDDDDDACVEILLVTPLPSADVILSSGNQSGSYAAPTAEVIMVDDVVAPSAGASRSRPSSGPAPLFKDVSCDAIHTDFFPFSAGPYYVTYPMTEVFKDPAVCKTIVDQFPTPGEMVRVESFSDDQLTAKMSVLHCIMMSHGGELLARYRGLNQYHHEYVLSTDSRLKGYKEKVASLTGLELQVSDLKKQVSGLNELSSSDASFAKSKVKGKERKKNIKSLIKSVDNLHSEVARLSAALNQATGLVRKFLASDEFSRVQGKLLLLAASAGLAEASPLVAQTNYAFINKISEHATEPLSVILQLEPKKLVRPANVPASREVCVSPPPKESTVTTASKSLELSTNVNFTASTIASEHNEEMVNAEVDGSDSKMTDDTAAVKSGHAFVQGIFVALDDSVELVEVGLGSASSSPNDVVVALSAHEKGGGLDPSSVIDEEILSHVTRPRPNGFPLGTCSIAGQASVEMASPGKSASQSLAWSDVLNFKRMAYECILSSRLTRIIPTPDPSLIVSLPKYILQALGVGVDFA